MARPVPASVAKQAELRRLEGNTCFKKERIGAAVDAYTEVGKFDPITREPLEQHQLVPNLAIKQAVQVYLNEHGWAYKMS